MGSLGIQRKFSEQLADENSFHSNLGSYEQNRQIRMKKISFANYMYFNTFNKIVIALISVEALEQQC